MSLIKVFKVVAPIRRSLKSLEKAGIIEIQSLESKLIFKCLLLDRDNSLQNKLATKSPAQTATKPPENSPVKSRVLEDCSEKAATPKSAKPAIPQYNPDSGAPRKCTGMTGK